MSKQKMMFFFFYLSSTISYQQRNIKPSTASMIETIFLLAVMPQQLWERKKKKNKTKWVKLDKDENMLLNELIYKLKEVIITYNIRNHF